MESKLRLVEDEEEIQYQKDHRVRAGNEPRKRKLFYLFIAVICVYIVCLLVPNPVDILFDPNGYYQSPADYLNGFVVRMNNMKKFLMAPAYAWSMWNYLMAFMVGAGLAVTGGVYQGSFRNAIASPTTLGVMSGGRTGAILYLILSGGLGTDLIQQAVAEKTGILSVTGYYLAILVGCFAAVAFTTMVAVAAGRGKISSVALIVTGMVFSSATGSIDSLVQLYYQRTDPYGELTAQLRYALGGNIYGYRLDEAGIPIAAILILLIIMMLQAKKLNLLSFGEDEARAMGVNVKQIRRRVVVLSTILTAIIIAYCGGIGFVGLVIPHIARRVVGSDFRYFLPATILIGGIFMMVCRYMPSATWMSSTVVGVWSGMLGGALFLFIIIRERRLRNADWA